MLFGSNKGEINYDLFPKPPSGREIIEDIEHLTAEDPVMGFAELLQEKGVLALVLYFRVELEAFHQFRSDFNISIYGLN